MEVGEGMVAVVRGLQGSGLAVTLLDSGRQFSLLPENFTHPAPGANTHNTNTPVPQGAGGVVRRESGVQATDGRYTSTYKMMHCHSTPTSPPDLATEFPPQRPDVYPGHGNFVVGGQGSGESYCYPTKTSEFRGGMCWPDRGSVCSPRPSLQPDAFASSLRKYPTNSQDRSAEMVERLINYTQAKNSHKNNRNMTSRNLDFNVSNQTFFVDPKSRHSSPDKCMRGYQPEVANRGKRFEESRDPLRNDTYDAGARDAWRTGALCRTNDVRYLRDVSRKVGESIRSLSAQADNRPEKLNARQTNNSSYDYGKGSNQWSSDTVNMEIQAGVQMITREVMTIPRVAPSQRTVAISLTPKPSKTNEGLQEVDLDTPNFREAQDKKAKFSVVDMNIQTVSNKVEFSFDKKRKKRCTSRRRSRSEEKIKIIELMKYRNPGVIKQNYLKSRPHRKFHNKSKPSEIFVDFFKNFERQVYNVDIPEKRECASDKYRQSYARILCSAADDDKTFEADLCKILEAWMKLIPLRLKDKYDLEKQKKCIQHDFFNYLKRIANVPLESVRKDKIKADILDRLKLIHLDVKSNKTATLNKLAEMLINNVTCGGRRRWEVDGNMKRSHDLDNLKHSLLKSPKSPTEKYVEDFVSKYTTLFLQRFGLKLHKTIIKDIEDELFDIFTTSIDAITNGGNEFVKRDIAQFLNKYGLSEQKAYSFAKALIKYFKETFVHDKKYHAVRSETLILLPNLYCNQPLPDHSDLKVNITTEEDIITNLTYFKNKLCQEIQTWFNDLKIKIPQVQGKELHISLVNNLAEEIIERHKYLELAPFPKVPVEADLEFYKYQVFKLINKLAVQDNLNVLQCTTDLIKRIQNIPVPMLIQDQNNFDNQLEIPNSTADKSLEPNINPENFKVPSSSLLCDNALCESVNEKCKIDSACAHFHKNEGTEHIINVALHNVLPKPNTCDESKPQCSRNLKDMSITKQNEVSKQNYALCSNVESNVGKNNDQLEAEYDQFVKDWVNLIPMTANNSKEMAILEKARLGIYNGLWKVISKLNCDPSTYYNQFLYEDLLDDAVDDLLDCLPQSPELKSKRHLLKVKLIEKTISTNNQIKENEETSFKNKLIQNVVTNLRKQGITDVRDGNPIKLHEDMQITKLVENYLLLTKFKNEDRVVSNVYRRKLIKEVEEFVKDLVKNHANELKNIDIASYESNIMNLLSKVPLPSENTIKQEADDILLGIEIEQWYSDLPIVANNDYTEQYQRRKQRDILVKKIKEIENKNDLNTTDIALRNEVSKFLDKAPLEEGESLNINFMVDELLNRLNNKIKFDKSQNTKRLEFQTPDRYDEFSKNISRSSSLTKVPKSTRFAIHEPPSYRVFDEERPLSSSFNETTDEQWLTLQKTLPDVGTQTNNRIIHKLASRNSPISQENRKLQGTYNDTGKEAIYRNYPSSSYHPPDLYLRESKISNRDIDSFRKDYKAGSNVDENSRQLNNDLFPRDPLVIRGEFKNEISKTEGDPLLKCSKLCQADGETKDAIQVATESNAESLMDRSVDNKTIFNPIYATNPNNVPDQSHKRKLRVIKQEKGAQRGNNYDSDEEDVIPCNCIERYLKHRQKVQNYSCEEFGHLPSCVPIFYPYPYFIL